MLVDTCRRIEFERGLEVKVNPVTGATSLYAPPKRRPEIKAKDYDVPGLRIFDLGGAIKFEWITSECINEPMAIDAQCRAGWDDNAFGFGSFDVGILPDGQHRATWTCGCSNE